MVDRLQTPDNVPKYVIDDYESSCSNEDKPMERPQ